MTHSADLPHDVVRDPWPLAAALAAATSATPHPFSRTQVMGLSGLALQMLWANDDTPNPWTRPGGIAGLQRELEALRRGTGWLLEVGSAPTDREALRRRIAAAVQAGRPVVAEAAGPDVVVVYAVREHGEVLRACSLRRAGEDVVLRLGDIGSAQVYLGERVPCEPSYHIVVESLARGVDGWYEERRTLSDGQEYWSGDAAWGAWIRDLDRLEPMSPQQAAALAQAGEQGVEQTAAARAAAAEYLEESAALFAAPVEARVQRAAALCREVFDVLVGEGTSFQAAAGRPTEVERRRQQRALARARAYDAQAVELLGAVVQVTRVAEADGGRGG